MDSTAFTILGISVAWYAILIVLGLCLGLYIANKELKKHDFMTTNEFFDFIFYLLIWAFVGARTWYVVFYFDMYRDDLLSIFNIKEGGLAIHGGILGGFIYIVYYVNKRVKQSSELTDQNYRNLFTLKTLQITDLAVPSLLIGQAIGRFGNFINQEAHGGETTYEFLKNTLHLPDFIVNGMFINGTYYQPTFLYESVWNFIGFLIVILLLRNKWRFSYGKLSAFYLIWYGFIRTFIEMMRTDALLFFNTSIRVALVSSILMVICGILLFVYLSRKDIKDV